MKWSSLGKQLAYNREIAGKTLKKYRLIMPETPKNQNIPGATCPSPSAATNNAAVTAWLFGTFNPIHMGHVAMAQAALGVSLPNGKIVRDVVLVPAAASPWKHTQPDMVPYHHRLAMCRLAVENLARITVSDIEGTLTENLAPGEPLPTWQVLQVLHQQGDIEHWPAVMILGSDALANVGHWVGAEDLLANTTWLQAPRPGSDWVETVTVNGTPRPLPNTPLPMDLVDASSTGIRQRNHTHALPKAVLDYLNNHQLVFG